MTTYSAAQYYEDARYMIRRARYELSRAWYVGTSDREERADCLRAAASHLLKAAEWRDAARARRRLETRMLPS